MISMLFLVNNEFKKGYFCFIAGQNFSPTYSTEAPDNSLKDSLANQDGVNDETLMVGNDPNSVASTLIEITNNELELTFCKETLLKFFLNSAIEMQKLLDSVRKSLKMHSDLTYTNSLIGMKRFDSIFMHCANFVENELLTNILNEVKLIRRTFFNLFAKYFESVISVTKFIVEILNILINLDIKKYRKTNRKQFERLFEQKKNLPTQIDLSLNFGLSIIDSKLKSYEKTEKLEKNLRTEELENVYLEYYDNNIEEKEILLIESIIVAAISALIRNFIIKLAREVLFTIKTVEKLSEESASILSVNEQLLEAQIKHIQHIITEKNKEIE
ncbi:hypothetical protein FG379_003210 [Cryptosporidium bovis]|uniref:uncharacterized protein n=1 Tax=Cryptosporidium bovis TaxID=310047 RepID=UPI003519E778|nr:hypothetical protein FG379_003210 [Cryptosporidium bovis]